MPSSTLFISQLEELQELEAFLLRARWCCIVTFKEHILVGSVGSVGSHRDGLLSCRARDNSLDDAESQSTPGLGLKG
jgi:hypothetical protein